MLITANIAFHLHLKLKGLFKPFTNYLDAACVIIIAAISNRFCSIWLTHDDNCNIGTSCLSTGTKDCTCVHTSISWFEITCWDSLRRLSYGEAVPRAIWCPSIECSNITMCLTSERQRTGCSVVGSRSIKGWWRSVADGDGYIEGWWSHSISCCSIINTKSLWSCLYKY